MSRSVTLATDDSEVPMPSPTPGRLVESVAPASSIQYNNRVYEMTSQGRDVITLSLGEAFFDVPTPYFDNLPAGRIHHYSHSRGLPLLREKLATYYKVECQTPVDPETELVVTAGSKAAIYLALLALIDPGDEVLILEPSWVSYVEQVRLCRGVPVQVPWYESAGDLERYVTPRTRLVIVNNPNNPSGHVLGRDELGALYEVAERHGLQVLADEAYNEFVVGDDRFLSCGTFDPHKTRTVICNSMSKNYGMSGWRIGYAIAHPDIVNSILTLNQHIVTCAPTILSYYLAENFDGILDMTRPQIRDVVTLRNGIADELTARGIGTMPGSSTFYLFVSLGASRLDSDAFASRLLEERQVSVVPGAGYGPSCERFVRVAVGSEPEHRVRAGVSAVCDWIEETS
ncbi:pyridoxal phosphate-dependent aminotransferase [Streptomyces armeniacus]|uniref:Aminotransferase n=1 Tax=Streptomyces armeniacus TaxID=83291 RepID=A0A345XM23_9ACTN|nr:pyridoxal phosphate-dependent aminotransferase [Streptomyces armeniacus]AXK32689.1 pyridoxal phosphate-dependent aminotransferase [Streptomyces armeniacus]